MHRIRMMATGGASALVLSLVPVAATQADDPAGQSADRSVSQEADAKPRPGKQAGTKRLRKAVTTRQIMEHNRAFQRIANRNDGNRASGTPGYDASADYVMRKLKRAGYRVREQEFTFPFFQEFSEPVLEQTDPMATTYETGTFSFSGDGDVTGTLVPIDLTLPPPAEPGATSGCEAEDFPAPGEDDAIALVQRGTCAFGVKAQLAQDAGYDAVIIFNEGQEGRTDLTTGTLGDPVSIPVVGASFEDGAALAAQTEAGDVTMHVATDVRTDPAARTSNIIATTRTGNPNRALVVGAHLDSVTEGAGINDNGSGSATILEIAEQMAKLKIKPRQQVRFAFWGAEESGLLGSEHYVKTLTKKGISRIMANLNFDMVGSPNYARFIYDGDGSDTELAGPAGSGKIEQVFTSHFRREKLASAPTEFSGRSDYGPFIAVGIPAGGLFTGAEGIKTAEEAALFGGTAGEAYDKCYHAKCDNIRNVSTKAIGEMSDAAAHAVLRLAQAKRGFLPARPSDRVAQRSAKVASHAHELVK
ncbi:M28 family metallopeptidase [Nocardioides pacificus]